MMTVRKIKCIKESLFTNEGDILIEYGLERSGLFYFENAETITGNGLPIDQILKLKEKRFDEYFQELEPVEFSVTSWGQYAMDKMRTDLESLKMRKKSLKKEFENIDENVLNLKTSFYEYFGQDAEEKYGFDFDIYDQDIAFGHLT